MATAGFGHSARSKVTIASTNRAAPALCSVASGRGNPPLTAAMPMQIWVITATNSKPPAKRSLRLRARRKVATDKPVNTNPTARAPRR